MNEQVSQEREIENLRDVLEMTFDEHVLKFYKGLRIKEPLPPGIEVMNPYQNKSAFAVCKAFYGRFYNDHEKRIVILGINPGRFGAGITGVPFTDPIKLETLFGIPNDLPKKPELSAEFIHAVIAAFGGPEQFFSKFFINSISPLGFTKDGKNLNYYDTPQLRKSLAPFIRRSMQLLVTFNIERRVAFCLGEGTNYKYLQELNANQNYFERIVPLAHPRFIMQYRRRKMADYLADYVQKLSLHFDP